MPFEEVQTFPAAGTSSRAPVLINVSKPGDRQRITITVRPSMLDGGLPFWKENKAVSVKIGTGADAGILRIEPNGAHKLFKLGNNSANSISLAFPVPAGITVPRVFRTGADFDYADGWIEITLPEWAHIKSREVDAPPPGKGPFRTGATAAGAAKPVTGGR